MPPAVPRILFWCRTTANQPYVTGVQRVVRRLGAELEAAGLQVTPVGWDGERRAMTPLTRAEQERLGFGRARAPLEDRWNDGATWLVLPETAGTWHLDISPGRLARAYGIRTAALVHDMIPVTLPDLYAPAVTAHFGAFCNQLAEVDLVLTTTDHVATDFRNHLHHAGLLPPTMRVVPLGGDALAAARPPPRPDPPAGSMLSLLMVGTWEPRKNHLRVLAVLRRLFSEGLRIRLTVVGRRGHDAAYDQAVLAGAVGLPDVSLRHRVGDAELRSLMLSHDATIYPSIEEGFGLPVLESLWMGVPCLCHAGSATQEVAPGGGTLAIDMRDETAIGRCLRELAEHPSLLRRLRGEASARPIRTWREVAAAVIQLLAPPSW